MPVTKKAISPVVESLCVSARCTGPVGNVEYRGVHSKTHAVIFRKRPMREGTENIGEFLAIVHGLAHLKNQAQLIPIYSDSAIARRWIHNRNINTRLQQNQQNQEIFGLVDRAITWLRKNTYSNPILAWNAQAWGTIPASFYYQPPTFAKTPTATITITGNTYKLKEQFKQIGMTWRQNQWVGTFPVTKLEKLKDFCRHYNLQYSIEGDGIKETGLARGTRPISGLSTAAVMGEGAMQWAIEETIDIERQRRQKQLKQKKKQS